MRDEKANVPEIWEDKKETAMKKPAQREKKKIQQRNKQEQKRKGVGRSSWTNFLKRKALPMTVKKEETGSRRERTKEGTKEDEERDIREKKWRGKAQRRGDRPER